MFNDLMSKRICEPQIQSQTRTVFADDNMNDGEEQHGDHIHNINKTRTKWTSGMCNDILTCREKAAPENQTG